MKKLTRDIIISVYDNVHAALWAALIAFLFYFALVIAPKIPDNRAAYEAQQHFEISAENNLYCKKFGFTPETRAYARCILDLEALRAKIKQRLAEEADFW
ncbi:MAG: hypothetical protein JSR61_13240 [Proteobacteria bacterium]|nr:hypothetical protein [Pseudomonadota bacterium]